VTAILLVDPVSRSATALVHALQDASYEVYRAHDGLEGLRLFYERHPDAVVIGAPTPKLDAFELVHVLRAISAAPILLLVDKGAGGMTVRALDADALASRLGQVAPHRFLLSAVWGDAFVDDTHYLRMYIGYLRLKLEDDPAHPTYLRNEWGVGYRLAAVPVGAEAPLDHRNGTSADAEGVAAGSTRFPSTAVRTTADGL
jgi:DNA-binding response OmpR family regulator